MFLLIIKLIPPPDMLRHRCFLLHCYISLTVCLSVRVLTVTIVFKSDFGETRWAQPHKPLKLKTMVLFRWGGGQTPMNGSHIFTPVYPKMAPLGL